VTAIVLALVTSVAFGVSDFFGALAARGRGAITGTAAVYAAATAITVISLAFLPWEASAAAILAGLSAGLIAIAGFVAFYAALAIGPMSVLSPSIALVNTLVPVAAAVLLGEALMPLGWVGIIAALSAGVLVSAEPSRGQRTSWRGLGLALLAGLLLGAAIVALDAAPPESGVLPAVLDTAIGLVVILPLLAFTRRPRTAGWLRALDRPELSRPSGRSRFAVSAITAGILLGAANLLLVLALQSGALAIVSVLVSLYPVVTVVLAASILRERLAAPQLAGVALALVAAVLLSLS